MAVSRRPNRTGRSRFTLVLLVLTSITVLTLDFRGSGVVDGLRGGASTVFGPLRDAAAWVGRPFANAWNGITGYGDLEAENEALRERVAELEGSMARAEDAEQQLAEIAALERLRRTVDLPTLVARVTGGPITNFEQTIELDRGSSDGVAVGMPVATGAGLVGKVIQVTPNRSVVQLIVDPSFEVGIRLVGSGEVGIGRGIGSPTELVADAGIELGVEIDEGEVVTTSGVSRSLFPPDIPIGRVTSVEVAADQLSQVLRIELLADLEDLSWVQIILWQPDQPPPVTAPDPATTAPTAPTAPTGPTGPTTPEATPGTEATP